VSRGPVWGGASEDLNGAILVVPAGEGPAAHVNESRDVLYVVVEGTVELTVDDETHALRQGDALIVPKGARRALVAGPAGVKYATAHLRRPGLEVKPLPPQA